MDETENFENSSHFDYLLLVKEACSPMFGESSLPLHKIVITSPRIAVRCQLSQQPLIATRPIPRVRSLHGKGGHPHLI